MALRFIGIDPSTDTGDSPTVWIDEDAREFVIQGWRAGEGLREQVTATPAPNHKAGVPDHEDVIRVPLRMAGVLRKACDVADGLG
ncbi:MULTISPECIES: hypothetical protein [Streptacidiphilus]|uniref:DUF429 domain-containing protein n=1 Tax=Streptacidiphilus cavernicola TaxID=3342716 RepID=A0ABV6UYN1_9ACTN|nr:hypothetical protein [Streptacidiphilus jeojiense]